MALALAVAEGSEERLEELDDRDLSATARSRLRRDESCLSRSQSFSFWLWELVWNEDASETATSAYSDDFVQDSASGTPAATARVRLERRARVSRPRLEAKEKQAAGRRSG